MRRVQAGHTVSSPQCSIRRPAAPDSAGCGPGRRGGAGRGWRSRSAALDHFHRHPYPHRQTQRDAEFLGRGEALVAAHHHQQTGPPHDPRRVVPLCQLDQRVGADEQEPFRLGLGLPQLLQRIHGIAGARTPVLALINAKGRMAGNGQVQHFRALGEWGDGLLLLVRRPRRRHEQHLVQPPLLAALLRQDQVPEMHRIECAAKDADTHGWLSFDRSGPVRLRADLSRPEAVVSYALCRLTRIRPWANGRR